MNIPPLKFWKTDFNFENNKKYRRFDIVWGILLPIIALIIDPAIFKSGGFWLLVGIHKFVFIGVIVSVISLAAWLFLNQQIRWFDGLIGGILLTAGVIAFILQLIMLPLALIAVIAIITIITNFTVGLFAILVTILGFLPLLTGLVYLRNGLLAKQQAKIRLSHRKYIVSVAIGTTLLLSASSLVQWPTNLICSQQIKAILEIDSHLVPSSKKISTAIQQLRESSESCKLPIDKLVWAYFDETDDTRKQFLANTYFEITQEEIEDRLFFLLDD